MELETPTLRTVATTSAYLLLGVVGTAAGALAVLYVGTPIQQVVYDVFYLAVGPGEATETAILTHALLAGFGAISGVALVGHYLSDRHADWKPLATGIGVLVGFVGAFFVVALLELAAFLTALVVLALAAVAVPILLRYRYDVRSGAVPAFVGGIPVLVLLLLLTGFGLGWGWGYVMTAEEVPASAVDGPVADFGAVPHVRADLLDGDCSTGEDRRTCRLYLRGYEHEARAVRFMADHGVRCPYQEAASGKSDSFIARANGTYYRITCAPHGD